MIENHIYKKRDMEKYEINKTYGYKDFISVDEHKELLYFVNSNLSEFKYKTNDKHIFGTVQEVPNYPKDLIENLRNRVVETEGIKKYYPDLMYEDVISIIYKNGYHLYHRDGNYGDWIITRYNIMLSVPEEGGLSLYGKEFSRIEERTLWKCVAGMVYHGVTKVDSDKPRISLCLGFMIKQNELRQNTKFSDIDFFPEMPEGYEYMKPLWVWNDNFRN